MEMKMNIKFQVIVLPTVMPSLGERHIWQNLRLKIASFEDTIDPFALAWHLLGLCTNSIFCT